MNQGTPWLRRGIALALCGLALGCGDPAARFERHLARADRYAGAGQPEDAVIELQNALALRPESADANERMGELLLRIGNRPVAALHFGEAHRLDPERVDALLQQARLIRNEQPRLTRSRLEEAAVHHPENAALQRAIAELARRMGDLQRAVQASERAVELQPDSVQSWLQLALSRGEKVRTAGGIEQREGQRAAALEAFAKVESLAGGHAVARFETAQLLSQDPERSDAALEAYRSALALSRERNLPRRRFLAAASFERFARRGEKPELVLEALREQVDAEPERGDAWIRLADATRQTQGPAQGWAVLERMLESASDAAQAEVTACRYLARNGRAEQAAARLRAAVESDLDHPLVWEQLVRIELGRGQLAAARQAATRGAERHPGHPALLRSRARLDLAERRLTKALERLREAPSDPPDPESELLRAHIEIERGRLASARSALDRALAGGFSEAATRLNVALHARSEQWAETLAALDALVSRGYALSAEERLAGARARYARNDRETGRVILLSLLEQDEAPSAVALEYAARERVRDPAGARRWLERALAKAPGRFELLEALTRLDLPESRDTALRRLDAALASGQSGPRVLLLRAELLAESGELERAEADAMRALEAAPQLPWAVDLAHAVYRAQGREKPVMRALEEAEASGSLHAGARVLLARLYLADGNPDGARRTYEGVIEANPRLAPARNDLAFLLASRGEDLELAQEHALAAQRALPGSPNVSDTLGFVLLKRGHAEAAAEQFRSAIQQARPGASSLPVYHYHLGLAAEDQGRRRLAAAQFQRALQLDPGFPGSPDARARLARMRAASEAEPASAPRD